jgi:hypothetical protein
VNLRHRHLGFKNALKLWTQQTSRHITFPPHQHDVLLFLIAQATAGIKGKEFDSLI